MGRHKLILTKAQQDAKEIILSERKIALAYLGEAKGSIKAAAILTKYSYSYCKKVVKLPHVLKFMDGELQKMGVRTRAVRNRTIKETVRVAQGDIVEVLREVLDFRNEIDMDKVRGLPKNLSAAIKSIEIFAEKRGKKGEEEYEILRTKIMMHDKIGALALLDKMLHISQEVEEDPDAPEDLRLMGMQIEGPGKKKDDAIDAEFKVLDKEESWLQIPEHAEVS